MMNRDRFKHFIVGERIKQINRVLNSKADEYATNDSAFYNFERAGQINSDSPKKALWGMATKHLVSVIDMVESEQDFPDDYIDEKIGDLINYLILLEGILKDKQCCGNWTETGECRDWCKK